jgi:hypothetical protein
MNEDNLDTAPVPVAETNEQAEQVTETTDSQIVNESGTESNAIGESQETDGADTKEHNQNTSPKLAKRFSKLTKQRYELQAQLDAMKVENEALKNKAADPLKSRNDFNDDAEWIESIATQKAQEMVAGQNTQLATKQVDAMKAQVQSVKNAEWNEKLVNAKTRLPDLAEVLQASDVILSNAVVESVTDSDLGVDLIYHLAKNPDEAQYINSLPANTRERYIGRLENKLDVKNATKQISQAPAPVGKPRGHIGGEAQSIDDWMAQRTKAVRG